VAAARDVPNVNVHEITVGLRHCSAYRPIGGIFGNLASAGFMWSQGWALAVKMSRVGLYWLGSSRLPAVIIEVRHSAGFSEQTRTALRAKTAAQRITTVCFTVVILNRASDL
jgi:hypothetical protein